MIDAWSNMIGSQPTTEVTALQQTVQQTNCVPCLKLLIDNGVNKSIGGDGTIFHILAEFSNSPQMRKARCIQGAPFFETFGYKLPDWYKNLPDSINGTAAEILELLVSMGVDDINKPRSDGFTPLLIALKGLNPAPGEKETKLSIVKGLIKNGADPKLTALWNYGEGTTTWRPICTASEYGDVELIKIFLDAGVDINTVTETINISVATDIIGGEGYTPLIISIMFNNLEVAKYLVDQGADLINGTEGYTFLYGNHEGEVIKCLADVEDKTPIYWALEKNDLELVKKIADKIAGESPPSFSFQVVSAPEEIHEGRMRYYFDRDEENLKPSEYGWKIGNEEGGDYCDSLGL